MKNKGFTLIELVVAIAILGVLMIIAIPSVKYIQIANKDSKFEAYGKAITSSAKVYLDGYKEDLFGQKNTGCALISYEDLKERDLIEKIQIKGVDCNNPDLSSKKYNTYVMVKKSKNGNYHYDSHLTCMQNGKKVYGPGPKTVTTSTCDLEDGSGPTLVIEDISQWKNNPKHNYHIDEKPNLRVTIADNGVGLKENQKVTYTWKRDGNVIASSSGTLQFKNKYYDSKAVGYLSLPNNIEKPTNSTTYIVEVKGPIEDVDNNKTNQVWSFKVEYYVGFVNIKYNVNGGSLATKHGSTISIKNSLATDGSNTILNKIRYKGTLTSDGLVNYNNEGYLNIYRTGYHIEGTNIWNTAANGSGKTYNQTSAYKASDFCSDIYDKSCDVVLYPKWIINTYTLKYNSNGGSACSNKTQTHGSAWGTLCTPTRANYQFLGWKDERGNTVTSSTVAVSNLNVTAQWKKISGNVIIKYHVNGGSLQKSHGSAYSIKSSFVYKNNVILEHKIAYGGKLGTDGLLNYNNSKALNIARSGYHIDSSAVWNTKNNGTGTNFDQTSAYSASSFCDASKGDCTINLYANWKSNSKTVTIKFTKNGSSTEATKTCSYDTTKAKSCNITSPKISRKGWNIVGWATSSGATKSSWDAGKIKSVGSNDTYYAVTYKSISASFKYDGSTKQNITKLADGSNNTTKSCNIYNTGSTCSVTTPGVSMGKTYNSKKQQLSSFFVCKWGSVTAGSKLTIKSGDKYNVSCVANSNYTKKKDKVFALSHSGSENVVVRIDNKDKIYNNGVAKSTNQGSMDDKHAFKWDGDWIIDKSNKLLWFHGTTVKSETHCTSVRDSKTCSSHNSKVMTGWISARLTYHK